METLRGVVAAQALWRRGQRVQRPLEGKGADVHQVPLVVVHDARRGRLAGRGAGETGKKALGHDTVLRTAGGSSLLRQE